MNRPVLAVAALYLSLTACGFGASVAHKEEGTSPRMMRESPSDQYGIFSGPASGPRMAVVPNVARPGDTVTLRLKVPEAFVWGLDSYLDARRGEEWARVFLVWNDPDRSPNQSEPFEKGEWPEGVAVRTKGFHGDATIRIKLPAALEPGKYRIVKTFVAEGNSPLEERVVQRAVDLIIE